MLESELISIEDQTSSTESTTDSPSMAKQLISKLKASEKDTILELLILGVRDMEDLMRESRGVCGLHLNGEEAEWSSLVTGGRYEEWLHRWNQGVVAINDAEEQVSSRSNIK